jgi:hypothetical protein
MSALPSPDLMPAVVFEEEGAPPSRTDLRHLRLVVDLLKNHRLPIPAEEAMRAVTELEQLRPAHENNVRSLETLRLALAAVDKAEATLTEKFVAWQAIDIRSLTKEQRMERREWETEYRRDVEYARRRLMTAARALLETSVKRVENELEREMRRIEAAPAPTPAHVWMEDQVRSQ